MVRVCAAICMAYGASMAAFAAQPAATLPTGGQVAAGQAAIGQSGNTLTVNQTSQRAVLNWNTFNVGSNAAVEFKQPNSQAVVLNRVTSATPSQIDGAIHANGRVIISNTNGVTFGKGAEVNAGAVVATTMNQSDADFMSGSNTFEGNGTGKVVNKGKINITDPQGYVALLAPEVRNQGVILATVSSHNAVVVGAAEKLTLNFKDSNLIGITVDKAAVNALIQNKRAIEVAGGVIVLATGSANQLIRSVIQNTGQISANSMTSHGGVVELVAGTVNNNGRITANAQGVGNGGTVKVVADNVALGTKSDIQVNAGTHGNGGTVQIWANQQAAMAGQISATGGSVSGNGGSIGTSAKLSVTFDPQFKVDTSAKNGRFGQWVIDPLELTIDANAASLISAALRNTNVTLDATGSACVGSLANCTTSILPLVNFLAGANIYSDNASTTLRVLAAGGTVNVNNNIDAGQVYIEAANISVKGNIGSTGGANGGIVLLGGQINILGGLGSNGQGTNATNSATTIGNNRRRLGANAGLAADDSSYNSNGGSILISATGDVVIDADATVTANGLAGGQIAIVSQLGTVIHRGVVDAVGTANQGGNIKFEADSITLEASSQINAVGALGGGTVLVGGDWQGGGTVRQATLVSMRNGASIDASAIQKGHGGKVVLWSDVHSANSITSVSGSIYAKGGANGGDGGQVETSGHLLKVDGIAVNTSAIGIAGNWLLDPDHIVINTSGTSYTNTSGTITSNGCTDVNGVCSSYIDHQIIESALSNGNVTIQTVAGKNITVQSDGTITLNSSITNSLTLSSGGNITFDYQASAGGINAPGVALVLTASTGSVAVSSPLTVKSVAVNAVGFTGSGNLTLGSDGLTVTQSGDSTYTGVISDSNAKLIKDGSGILTLSGASKFTGGTTINGGTLKLGASFNVAINSGSGGGNVYASGTVLDSPLGLGPIRINGGGTLDLNGYDFSNQNAVQAALHPQIILMAGTDALNQAKLINSSTSSSVVYGDITLINANTAFAIADVIAQKTGSGTLTLARRITDDASANYAGIQTGTTNYAGKVIFNAVNTFRGGITVNAGTLQAGWQDALGAGDITVLAGAVLDIKGFDISTEGTLTLNGTGISGNGALINSSASAASYPGLLALGSSASIVAETGSISFVNAGAMSGATYGLTLGGAQGGSIYSIIDTTTSSVTKTGSGTWLLAGANTYSGATTVSAGTLKSGSATAFGSGNISVTAGAVVDLNGQTMSSSGGLTLNGTGISSGGALINTSSNPATYAGLISLGSSATIVGDTGSIALTAAGIISGSGYSLTLGGAQGGSIGSIIGTSSGALTKIDGGTWSLSGTNTYTGITTINGGKLSVLSLANGGTASGIGQSSNAAANLVINGGTLQYTGATASTDRIFTIGANGATLDASGVGALTFGAVGSILFSSTTSTPTLTLTGSDIGTFTPVLGNAGTTTYKTALTKSGTGTWTLSGSNTYTGVTTINRGVLSVSVLSDNGSSNLGGSTAASVADAANLVINGGTLRYTGTDFTTGRVFTIGENGATLDASGSSGVLQLNRSTGNAIAFSSATSSPTLTLTGSGAGQIYLVLNNPSSGTSSLTKTGSGTWNVVAASTYTGVTTITGGVLSTTYLPNGGVASSIGKSTSAASNLVINGGTLRYAGTSASTSTDRSFTMGANGATLDVSGAGQFIFYATTMEVSSDALAPTLTLTGTRTGTFYPVIINPTSGVTALTKSGAGTWILANKSSFTGAVSINAGVLSVTEITNAGASSQLGASTNAASNLVINGGTLQCVCDTNSATYYSTDRLFTVGENGASIDALGAYGVRFTNVGAITPLTSSSRALTLKGSATGTLASVLSDPTSGTLNLIKLGNGTWTLSGSNTYTGGSNVNAGTLNITSNGNLGASGDINLNGGTLKVSGSSAFTSERTLNLSASSTINNSNSAGITFTGNVQSTSGSSTQSLTIAGSYSTTFSTGIISNGSSGGTLSFIQNSSGTTTLSGNNTFSGGSTISSGFLKIGSTSFVFCGASILCGPTTSNAYNGSGSSSPLGIGSITINANGTLDLNGIGNATSGYLYNPITMAGTWDNGGSKILSAASLTTSSGTSVGIYSPMVFNKGTNPDLYIGLTGFERIYLPTNSNSTLTLYGVISDGGVGTTSAYLEIGQNNGTYGLQSGTVVLSGQNTYSGKISINQAVLKVGGASALGSVGLITIGKTINDTLGTYTSSYTTLDLAGQSIATPINLYTGNLLNSTGSVDVSGGITVSSGAAGVIAASNLATLNIKTTGISALNNTFGSSTYTGTVILSAANTAGTTAKLAGGTLQLANASALPNAPLAISAGTLDLMGYSPSIGALTVTGAATIQDFGATPGALTASSVNVSNSSGFVNISAVLAGVGGLTMSGSGALSLSAVNTYSGITTISGGTLSVALLADGGVASGIGQSSNAANNLVINGGALQFLGGTAQSSDRLFTVGASGATIDVAGVGALTFSNAGALGATPATSPTLTLKGSGSASLAASFSNPATSGTSALTKLGTGTWTLSNSNSFTGITRINGGMLSVYVLANGGSASGIGQSSNTAGNLLIDGGTLRYTGAAQSTDRSFTIGTNGATLDASGTGLLTFASSGNVTFTGSANITLTLSGNGNGEFTSKLVNPSGLTSSLLKSSTGTWKINASSTYTGTTNINGGVLKLGVATPFESSSGVTVNSGGALDVNNFTLAKLVKLNAGTVTNSNGQNGALSAGVTLLANSTLSAASGATFIVTNTMITGGYGLTIGSGSNLGKVVFGSPAVSATGSYTGTTTVIAGATLQLYISAASPTFNSSYDGAGTIIIEPLSSGSSIALGGTGAQLNLPLSLFASGGKFADGFANIVIGNSSVGSSLTVTGAAAFMDSVTLLSGGDITIKAGASVSTSQAGGNLVVAASGRFLNLAGSSALSTTDAGSSDRWIVYSADPSTTNFGTSGALVSGNKAYWGSTYSTLAPASIASGNRYVFNTAGTVTVITSNASMTYGVPVDLSNSYTVSNASMNAAPTGAPYISNVQADLFTTAPNISSTGNTATAAVGEYDVSASGAVIATGFGTLTYTNTGKLTVNPATITISVAGVKIYDGSKIFNALDLTVVPLPNGDALATATANSANVADNGSNYFVDFSMATGTKSNYVLVNGYNASTNSATINKANAYVLVNASQSSYYGVSPVVNYSFYSNAAGTGGSVISPSPSGTAVFTNAPSATSNAATYALKYASGLTSANYLINAATSDVNYVVNPAPVVVTGASNTATYNGSLQTNSGASVTVNGNAVSLASGTLTTGIGSDSFTLSGYGSGTNASGSAYADTLLLTPVAATAASNYSMTYNNGGLTIGKANAYVMVGAGQTSTYGIAPTINYSFYSNAAGTGGAVVTSTTTGSAVFINAPTPTSDAATYSLTYASGLSSTNYTFNAASGGVNYVVNPAPLVVTGANTSSTYTGSLQTNSGISATVNGNAVTVSSNTISTGIGSDSFTVAGFGLGTNANASAYADNLAATRVGVTRAANYSISYTNGGLTIGKANVYVLVTAGQSSTYGISPTVNYTFYSNAAGTGGAVINSATSGAAVFTNAPTATSNAAAYSLTYASGLSSTNYIFNPAASAVNYVVNPASLVLSGANNTVTYNGLAQSNSGGTATVNGNAATVTSGTIATGIGSDSFTISGYATGTDASTTAYGDQLVVTPASGTLAGNYAVSYNQGGLTIGKANAYVLVGAGQSSTYGASPVINYSFYSNAAGTGSALINTATTGLAAFTNAPTASSNAATYSLTYASGLASTNYAFNAANSGVNFVVNPAPLVVTVNNDSKFVTQSDASGFNGVSYSGFVLGQSSTTLGGSLVFSRSNNTQNNAGSYLGVLQVTGLTSQNYAISYVAGDYTIVPAETLIIKTTNMGVTYGANIALAPVSVEYLTGVSNVNGPNVLTTLTQSNASGNTFTYSDGVGGTATFTLAASGTNSTSSNLVVGNYNIAGVNFSKVGSNFNGSPIYSGVLAVSQKAVTASTSTVSKVYDSTTAMGSLSLALSNVVPGDVVTIGGVGSFAQAAVGSNIQYQVSNLTLNGTDSANYYLSGGSSFTGNNGAITAATLNVVGANTTLAYTGTALSNSVATVSGLKGSDSFTVTGYGTGTNASVTPYADTLQATADSGTSAGNYNIIYTNGALTIGKANAYVLVTPSQTSTYGLTPGIAYSFYTNSSGVGGSAVVPSATGTAVFTNAPTATSNSATYSLTYASGLTSSNYILNPAAGGVNYVVNPAPLVVTGANNNATYSGLPQINSGASATVNGTAATVTGNSIATGIGSDTFTIGGYAVGTHASSTAYADALGLTAGSGTLPGNYSITYNNGGLTIVKATLTVTAENKTKLYGDANPALTYTITGYVNNEGASALTGSPTLGTGATLTSNVGTAPITAGNNNLAANDYNFNFVNGTLTISPSSLSVVGANTNVTYTAAAQTNSAANVIGLKNNDSFAITGYATGTNASVTAYADNLSATAAAGTSAANYNIAYTNGGITIGKANLNVSATASLTGHVYNALPYTGTYTTTLLGSDSITVTGMATGTNAGTYPSNLQISGAALSNYNTPVISNANLVVDPKPVTLTNNVSTTTYNATSTYASLMSTAGFSATALVGADAVGSVTQGYTVSGAAVSGIAQASTFVATPSAAVLSTGNVNNYAFTYVPSTNTVAKANVSFTATASLTGNVYNGSAFTGTYTSTLLGSDTATVTGLATGINAGTYASNLQVSGAAMANYNTPLITNASLVIDQKPLTISGQTAVNKVYTGTTAAALDSNNASLVGVVSGDAVTLDASNAFGTFASDNVANGIAVTVAGNALSGVKAVNYSLSQPTGLTANITPAPLVVTANDDAKFVTQNDAAGFKGVSYSGFVAGQGASDLTGSLVITRSNSSQNNAGPYAGVLVPSGLTSTNYSISYVNGDYTIVPAQTLLISTPNTSVNYGADISLSPLSVQYLDGANVLKNLTQTSATGNTFTYSDDVGGSATFTLAGIGNSSTSGKLVVGNYDIAGLNFTKVNNNFNNTPVYTGVLTVAQQSVSASTSTVSKVYDGTTAMNGLSLALSNVVTNDVVTVGGVGAFAQANKGTNINYSVSNLTLTGADSGNYYLSGGNSFNGTNGEITAAPLTVVGATTNTTYTGLLQTNAAATVTGLKGGDAFTVTGYASATNASATPYADNLVATPTAGTTASNYSITYTNGVLNIAKAPLTVTATSLTKPYDGQLYSGGNGVTYSGFVNNETLAVLGGTLSYTGTSQGANNAGTYVLTPAGLSSNNYAFNYVSGSLTIQPVVVAPEPTYWPVQGTLTGSVAKAYDGTVSASLLPSNYVLTGFISGQGATVLKTQGVYDNANVGAGKLVTVSLQASDFQATGTTNLANYILPTSISGRVGVISKATVSVTADKLSKPFMGVDPALTYTVSGLAGRDVNAQVLTGSPSRTPGEALGTYSVNVGTLAVGSNYELVFTPGSLQVVPGVLSSASSVFPFERKAQIGVVNTGAPVLLPEVSCMKSSLLRNNCAQSISLQSL
jgi:filamentous hemagglutinin family protein